MCLLLSVLGAGFPSNLWQVSCFFFPAVANVSRLRLLAKWMVMMISSYSITIPVRRGSVADRQPSRCRAAFGICWISRFYFAMSLHVSPSNTACLYVNSDNPSIFWSDIPLQCDFWSVTTTWGSPGGYPFREMSTLLTDFPLFIAVKPLFIKSVFPCCLSHWANIAWSSLSFIQCNFFVCSLLSWWHYKDV